ncbi:MAG: DUF4255 domain-containing protein [Chloroflexota bacterium]|nr:DUF4255 domain-containing protein [Chloroflexota bacterium]
MSSTFAIVSVTAVLKRLLENGLIDHGVIAALGADVIVSALPPDRITTGSDEHTQLNLFLYQITPNTGLSAAGRSGSAERRAASPPLTLDLYYLITSYSAQEYHMEILLGYAVELLHRSPEITGDQMQAVLSAMAAADSSGLQPVLGAVAASGQAGQIAKLAIRPQFPSSDELSKLWSALQARYRPSAVYKVSLGLIES